MKEAAKFWVQWLVIDARRAFLVLTGRLPFPGFFAVKLFWSVNYGNLR
jgi:hypothetical protein